MPPSWWIRVMVPVLCAVGVPGGRPAGMPSLNFWRFRISSISLSAAALTAFSCPIFSNRTRSARAVVALFNPLSNALESSTPRSTFIPSAPSFVTVARMFSTPSFSISRFAAKLLLTVIISSFNRRSVIGLPMLA